MPQPQYQRKKAKVRRKERSPHAIFSRRISVLTTVFVVICMVYATILISLQIKGNAYSIYKEKPSVPAGATMQTVTLQAMRGEIYDRNGKPLVTNVYSYELLIDYDPFVTELGISVRNGALLSLMNDLSKPEAGELTEDSFPLVGTYPNLSYSDEAMHESSVLRSRLNILLERIKLSPTASADALVSYYVDKYALDAHVDGIPAYTGEQITALIKIYYDMDLCRFGTDTTTYTLATNVSAAVLAANKETTISGVRFVVRAERVYHYPGYASHILGRVGKIFAEDWEYYNALGYPMNAIVGVAGCESAFESILHGSDGEMEITVDEQGRTIDSKITKQPVAGQDIRLTIDIDLQIAAEDALREQLQSSGASQKGAVVAMDPQTGAYLAIASAPTFHAENFNDIYEDLAADPNTPMLNRALSGMYFPGSLMYLCTATAGLDSGLIDASTMWIDSGVLKVQGQTLLCPLLMTQDSAHGYLGLSTAMVDKCDIFFGKLALLLGADRYSSYESMLGLGQKTGIELGEGEGLASTVIPNSDLSLLNAAIGASDTSCTPAQLCSMISSIVGGGIRYRGHLLYEVRDFTSGDVTQRTLPEVLSDLSLSDESHQLLLRSMKLAAQKSAVMNETALHLSEVGLSVGCLGATSPSGTIDGDHALMLAYSTPIFQLSDRTRTGICVAVVLENGRDAEAAAPVAAAVLEQFYE